MTVDLEIEARQLNAIDEPLSYRLAVASLITRHGRDAVRRALMREADRAGAVSIASAPRWREPRRLTALKAG
jgi:hypothetical protein